MSREYLKPKSLLAIIFLVIGVNFQLQAQDFSFEYTGPTVLSVGPNCSAALDWGHPNTPTATALNAGGFVTSFIVDNISGGFQIGDQVPAGTTVSVTYIVTDNMGNSDSYTFSIDVVDDTPPEVVSGMPMDVTISCGTDPVNVPNVVVQDNCESTGMPISFSFEESPPIVECFGGQVTRTWTYTDFFDNVLEIIQTITVLEDIEPPYLVNPFENGSGPCGGAVNPYSTWLEEQRAVFMADDDGCGLASTGDDAPSPIQVGFLCGDVVVNFIMIDNCGNIDSAQAIFTIEDFEDPVITVEAQEGATVCSSGNAQQEFDTWIQSNGGAQATDQCGFINWETIPANPTLANVCASGGEVTFVALDDCGNATTTTATFTITDNEAPVVNSDAIDLITPCSGTAPESLLASWLLTIGGASITDDCVGSANFIVDYIVDGVSLDSAGVQNAFANSSATGCQNGVSIGGTNYDNVLGFVEVIFIVQDGCGNEVQTEAAFGVQDESSPTITTPSQDIAMTCGVASTLLDDLMDWYDAGGNAVVSDDCANVSFNTTPDWPTVLDDFMNSSGPDCTSAGSATVEFIAVDGCGNETAPMSATFSASDDIAPTWTTFPSDLDFQCGSSATAALMDWLDNNAGGIAEDNCAGITYSFSWTNELGVLEEGIPNQGPYPNLGSFDCSSSLMITITASDACSNSVDEVVNFSINDQAEPVFTNPFVDITVSCGDLPDPEDIAVTDDCSLVTVSFIDSIANNNDTTACAMFNAMIMREWIASDECGNSVSAFQNILISDSNAPTFIVPGDVTVECLELDSLSLTGNVTDLEDDCDPNPTISYVDSQTGSSCDITVTRTWTAVDACGNETSLIQTINLIDNSPPTLQDPLDDEIVNCISFLELNQRFLLWANSINNLNVVDNCSAVNSFVARPGSYDPDDETSFPGDFPVLPPSPSCPAPSNQVIVVEGDFVFYDDCGNLVVHKSNFIVNDNQDPILNCPDNVTFNTPGSECEARVSLDFPVIIDSCYQGGGVIAYTYSIDGGASLDVPSNNQVDTLLSLGAHVIEFTVLDCASNVGTCSYVLTVADNVPPSFTCGSDITGSINQGVCTIELEIPYPENIVDDCGLSIDNLPYVFFTGATVLDNTSLDPDNPNMFDFNGGITLVNYVVEDLGTNADTCTIEVSITDNQAPQAVCMNTTITLTAAIGFNYTLDPSEIDGGTVDPCENFTLTADPNTFTCDQAGEEITVVLTAADFAGNETTCEAIVTVEVESIQPSFEIDLCTPDTLMLFSNINDTTGTISVEWNGPDNFLSNELNPIIPNVTNLNSGTYNLMISNGPNCMISESVEVIIDGGILPIIESANPLICMGDIFTLNETSIADGISYTWYQGAFPNGDSLSTTQVPSYSDTLFQNGVFSFYVIVETTECTTNPSETIQISVIQRPEATLPMSAIEVCENGIIQLSTDVSGAGITYLWEGPNNYSSTLQVPEVITMVTEDDEGVYTLTVFENGCASVPAELTVDVKLAPMTPIISGTAITCETGELILVANGVDADAFIWTDPLGTAITITDSDSLIISDVTLIAGGLWTVIASVDGCQSAASVSFPVTVQSSLDIEATNSGPVCLGADVVLSIPEVGGATYNWEGPGSFTSDEQNPIASAQAGTYTVTVTSGAGCSTIKSTEVAVITPPSILDIQSDANDCFTTADVITLTAILDPPDTGNYTYSWNGPNNFNSNQTNPTILNPTDDINGTYSLIVSFTECPSESFSTDIIINAQPDQPVIDSPLIICSGDDVNLSVDGFDVGVTDFIWSTPTGDITINDDNNFLLEDITVLEGGFYSVTTLVNGCESESSELLNLVVFESPEIPIITGLSQICSDDSLTLSTIDNPVAIFLWTGPSGTLGISNEIMLSGADLQSGNYSVAANVSGCDAFSEPFFVDVIQQPTKPILTSNNLDLCLDDITSFTVCVDASTSTTGASYTFTNAMTGEILGGPTTDLCIEIFEFTSFFDGENIIEAEAEFNGCKSEISEPLSFMAFSIPIDVALAGFDQVACFGDDIVLNGNTPNVGTGQWTYLGSNPNVIIANPNSPSTTVSISSDVIFEFEWSLSNGACTNYSSDIIVYTIEDIPEAQDDSFDIEFGQTEILNVIVNDLLVPGFTIEILQDPMKGSLLLRPDKNIEYVPDPVYIGADEFVYRICSEACPDICSIATVNLQVGNLNNCIVPSLFTPNNDGVNDDFLVPCFETDIFPNNVVSIFNQWGDEVYRSENYQNDWQGTYNGTDLPTATYYYVVEFGDGQMKAGYLILER